MREPHGMGRCDSWDFEVFWACSQHPLVMVGRQRVEQEPSTRRGQVQVAHQAGHQRRRQVVGRADSKRQTRGIRGLEGTTTSRRGG